MNEAQIEALAAEYISEDWTPDRYYREMNLIAFANKLLEHGYAEGRKDEREDCADALASRLIDVWCAAHGTPMRWAKSIELMAIVTKMPDAEKQRLLALGEEA